MRRETWLNALAAEHGALDLPARLREELARLDQALFGIWNLGDNVLLGWTRSRGQILVLPVRHYAIPESVHDDGGHCELRDAPPFITEVLSGPKYLQPEAFERVRKAFDCTPVAIAVNADMESESLEPVISDMVRCFGVTLVRNRAVVLLDVVGFSQNSPLDQLAMLNSLSYSVNCAYSQLLSKNIRIDFARTTTGDGFYIWNRATTAEANTELYKLMMMMLADNSVARSKARGAWVPRLRAAYHVGEHYEFHQVEGLNPTNFSYIVGQVTVDLSRMVDLALPGQILIGEFVTQVEDSSGGGLRHYDSLEFVANTAVTLDQLNGLDISGGLIATIRCYLTGGKTDDGQFTVNRYHLKDKHGSMRTAYNAKINIHRDGADPIFLGLQNEDLWAFNAAKVEALRR